MVTHKQAEDRVKTGFWIHLACYIVVVSALAVLNYWRNPENLWIFWVAGGWGIGIVAHVMASFSSREKMIDRTKVRMQHREARQDSRDAHGIRDNREAS